MSIIATNNSVQRTVIPAGNYVARCFEMIQIGTVKEMINGDEKILQKIRIGWEFPNDLKLFNESKGEQPLAHSEEYTLSLHEKSSLRKMLASWRGKDFTSDEAKSFDVTVLLGKVCMVNIIHHESKTGSIYAKVASVSSVPKGVTVPDQINKTFVLSYDEFDFNKFNSLPDFIKEKMKTSIEFTALTQPNSKEAVKLHEDNLPAPKRNEIGDIIYDNSIDDLPF